MKTEKEEKSLMKMIIKKIIQVNKFTTSDAKRADILRWDLFSLGINSKDQHNTLN